MEIIEINENKITMNKEFIKNHLTELISYSNYNLNIILELTEILKDLKESETITILKDNPIFNELLEVIDIFINNSIKNELKEIKEKYNLFINYSFSYKEV